MENNETQKLMEEYSNKRTATIGYFVLSIAVIMILGIALCVTKSEKNLLKKHYETRNKINYL
jgi:hypothetical protein